MPSENTSQCTIYAQKHYDLQECCMFTVIIRIYFFPAKSELDIEPFIIESI